MSHKYVSIVFTLIDRGTTWQGWWSVLEGGGDGGMAKSGVDLMRWQRV